MIYAIDCNGNKIHINSAKRNHEYFCPCCESKVVLKMGEVRAHHFAHDQGSFCQDSWHYDMSFWHYDWQSKFPDECQEVVKTYNGQKHRADVLLEKEKLVFEFQHSSLSPSEFEARNVFYNALGYKVIWIFDAEDAYYNEQIENYKGNLWSWKRPRNTLDYFDCKSKSVEVYLQLEDDVLVKATWNTSDNGFSRFATDGYEYHDKFFVNMFNQSVAEENPEVELSKLYDSLVRLHSKDHTTYFFGCPISSTHMCASCNIDLPKSKYVEIMPCMDCEFECEIKNYGEQICRKRFSDLGLGLSTLVRIEGRDKNGFVNKLSFIEEGVRKYLELETFDQNISKSIFDLWQDEYSAATFRNVRTGKYVRITRNPKEQYGKYRKVYGWFSSDRSNFSGSSRELFNVEKAEWVCEWFK